MTFSPEILNKIEKRKELYPYWKTEGMPLVMDCTHCGASYMRIHFGKKATDIRIACEKCEYVIVPPTN